MAGRVRSEKEGPIGWVVFDHPERRNALSANMWGELAAAVNACAADDEIRVVVMRGAGDIAFVSGADISQFAGTSAENISQSLKNNGSAAFIELARLEKPLLAMIHGFCIGGGVAVALAADLRYAASDATFAIPAARLAVGYDMVLVAQLAEIVGLSAAKEILFTARRYSADEARRMGLVNHVLPKSDLETFVRDVATQIAANAPLTVRSVKLIARELAREPAARDLRAAAASVQACFDSEDFFEGVKAFLEKRPPRFRGR